MYIVAQQQLNDVTLSVDGIHHSGFTIATRRNPKEAYMLHSLAESVDASNHVNLPTAGYPDKVRQEYLAD